MNDIQDALKFHSAAADFLRERGVTDDEVIAQVVRGRLPYLMAGFDLAVRFMVLPGSLWGDDAFAMVATILRMNLAGAATDLDMADALKEQYSVELGAVHHYIAKGIVQTVITLLDEYPDAVAMGVAATKVRS